jgi:hypothetical protein
MVWTGRCNRLLLACQGAIWSAVTGSMLWVFGVMLLSGGGVIESGLSIFMGPWSVLMMFLIEPLVFIMWVGLMAALHLLLRFLFKPSPNCDPV